MIKVNSTVKDLETMSTAENKFDFKKILRESIETKSSSIIGYEEPERLHLTEEQEDQIEKIVVQLQEGFFDDIKSIGKSAVDTAKKGLSNIEQHGKELGDQQKVKNIKAAEEKVHVAKEEFENVRKTLEAKAQAEKEAGNLGPDRKASMEQDLANAKQKYDHAVAELEKAKEGGGLAKSADDLLSKLGGGAKKLVAQAVDIMKRGGTEKQKGGKNHWGAEEPSGKDLHSKCFT